MENGNNDIKTYSAEDLARYWEGKMSPQEMHALESAAMDDPFLADALEGYVNIKPVAAVADINDLRERLLERSRDEKIVPIGKKNNWWRVAAILIFLGGAAVLTYLLMQQNNSNQLAKKEVPAAAQNSATVLTADTISAEQATPEFKQGTGYQWRGDQLKASNHLSEGVNQQGNASAPIAKSFGSVNVPDLSAYKPKDTPAITAAADKVSNSDSMFIVQNNAKRDQVQSRAGIENESRNMERLAYNNFSGRVVDQRNNAIPFASVRMNNNQVTSTNTEGYFQIKSPDTIVDVSVTSVGFEPRQLTLRGNEPQNVTLDEDDGGKKLKEVVVTGMGTRKKSTARRDTKLSVYVMDAEPVPGWDEYNKYLANNKRTVADSSSSGDVVISFWVNKNSKLSDFTVEQSLGKALDNEAIRLVREGPAWKLMKGKKTRARVIVTF